MADIKFFGQTFRTTFLFILLAELVVFFIQWMKIAVDLGAYAYFIIVGLVFIVSLYRLEYGVFAALVELFIGSQGHLLSINIGQFAVSIRIGIFIAVMLVWLIWIARKKLFSQTFKYLRENNKIILLALVCFWGLVFALIRGNSPINIFLDFNAWLYFLYFFPLVTISQQSGQINRLLQIFTASITATAIKALIFLYVFSHHFASMRDFYKWGRDTRWGEFTLIQGNLYRIFSQSQIFILIGFFIIIGFLIFKGKSNYRVTKNQYLAIILFLLLTTTIISLSRSFWVALILTAIVILYIAFRYYKFNWKDVGLITIRLLFLTVLSYGLINAIVSFPYPKTDADASAGALISQRFSIDDNALSSRWSQLPALTKEITKHPIIGSGWGSTVTYLSQDPRILNENNPSGQYTTFAFEWGYLDLILKIGLIGLIIYLVLLWSIFKNYLALWKKNSDRYFRALIIGFLLGLFALIITHGFSPYLNHPLGIGYIIILLAMQEPLSKLKFEPETLQ